MADTGVLLKVINSDNAIDYLVRSTSFAKSEALVPVMTSNNTPSGICSANAEFSDSFKAYKAFDNDSTTTWAPATVTGTNTNTGWIQYDFGTAKVCRAAKVEASSGNDIWTSVIVSGSNDNSNFTPLYESTEAISALNPVEHVFAFSNNTAYRYYRLTITSYRNGGTTGNYTEPVISKLQFYSIAEGITDNATAMSYIGSSDYASNTLLANSTWCDAICNSTYAESVLNVKVPTMTSNTTPSGECYATSTYSSSYPAWKAFDGDTSTYWYSDSSLPERVQYTFTSPQLIKYVYLNCNGFDGGTYPNRAPGDIEIKGSNDNGNTWTTLKTFEYPSNGATANAIQILFLDDNNTKYETYCVNMLNARVDSASKVTNSYTGFRTVQFYGRQNGGVQTWLRYAGITNKSYVTIGEVLNDTTTLTALIASESAMNYLVQCTEWTTTIASDETAMGLIGAFDYASNLLLSNDTWCTAIWASNYRESVLNTKVPTMTNDNTPSGLVFYKSQYSTSTHAGWYAFDNNTSNQAWSAANDITNWYVGYDFGNSVNCIGFALAPSNSSSNNNLNTYKIQGSTDNSTWTDLTETLTAPLEINVLREYPFTKNIDRYRYFRLLELTIGTQQSSTKYVVVSELQFYGRVNGGVQTWLRYAGIVDKPYTTLSQVLVDTPTLATLIASHDAMDYLVQCTSWASTICADQTAMEMIGADNYAANTLLNESSVWRTAICNSTYWQTVLNVSVPNAQTSVDYITQSSGTGWRAFYQESGLGVGWIPAGYPDGLGDYVQVKFDEPVSIFTLMQKNVVTSYNVSSTFKLTASNDGINFTEVSENLTIAGTGNVMRSKIVTSNNTGFYTYYRIVWVSKNDSYVYNVGNGFKYQLYGRKDV